jgi:hypothetical protein
MRHHTERSRTRRIMRSRRLWLLLALGSTIATTIAGIYLFGRLTELQEAAGQPTPWQQFATEATIRHWTGITLLCGIASLVLWLTFARVWNKASPTRSPALRYILAIAAAILGPCLLLAIFALL